MLFKRVFKGGMVYVVFSRVIYFKGLYLFDYDFFVIYVDFSVK